MPSAHRPPVADITPPEPAENQLPDDATFAYVVMHEAWYGRVVEGREISVQAAADEGGVHWEFMVEEVDLSSGPTVQVKVFEDAFAAFTQIPGFFAALTEQKPTTLPEVAALLDRLGAKDLTERDAPHGSLVQPWARTRMPRKVRDGLVSLGWTPPERES